MYVIESLKLNIFQPVSIPKGRDLFRRYGASLGVSYSGDQIAPMPRAKIDAIRYGSMYNERSLIEEASSASEATAPVAAAAAAAPKAKVSAPAAASTPVSTVSE